MGVIWTESFTILARAEPANPALRRRPNRDLVDVVLQVGSGEVCGRASCTEHTAHPLVVVRADPCVFLRPILVDPTTYCPRLERIERRCSRAQDGPRCP